ncbi:MAG TPA: DUF3175 domain-containing protein [Xanthobacteraceae bacterium]
MVAAPQRTSKRKSGAGRSQNRNRAVQRPRSRRPERRWSRQVTEHSDALTLDKGVFTFKDPKRIASSLRRSALRSRRRKADSFRSALSMLTFYINRAGRSLPAERKRTLVRAKDELRRQFGRA